jgi:hypothetical protein
MFQAIRQTNSIPLMIPIVVLAALLGATVMYLALPCGAGAAGTGPDCIPQESFTADVRLVNGYISTPSFTVTIDGDESGSDEYVIYAHDWGDSADSWVEIGRLDSSRAYGTIGRPIWILDGSDYEYYVVGHQDGKAGDYSNVVTHIAPPDPSVYRAFEKTGGYVVKWTNSGDHLVRAYNSQYKLRTEFDWRSSAYGENGYRRFNDLHTGRWYDFHIQSVSPEGRSNWVEVRRMVPSRSTAFPTSVRNFDAAMEDGNVKLSFDRYRDLTVVRFQVKRIHRTSDGGTGGVFDVWNQPDMENYVDESATEAGTYDYRMRAVNAYMEADDDRMNADTWSRLGTVTR